jgi:hypothetical protein
MWRVGSDTSTVVRGKGETTDYNRTYSTRLLILSFYLISDSIGLLKGCQKGHFLIAILGVSDCDPSLNPYPANVENRASSS